MINKGPLEFTVPSGKRLHNYGKSQFLMRKLTISMSISNSYVSLPQGNQSVYHPVDSVIRRI